MKSNIILFAAGWILLGTALAEDAASQKIFNGKDLTGWSGDPQFWSVHEGTIMGKSTAEHPVEANTFLIWQDTVRDFEFRAEFKLIGETANSGVQYRSRVEDPTTWIVGGYQADMDYANRYTGMLYEERGRGIIIRPGQRHRIDPGHSTNTPALTPLGEPTPTATLQRLIRQGAWNEILIIARGNHLRHYVNGVLTAEGIDEDSMHSATEGVLALQLHRGPPMTVQFRNLKLTPLP